MLNAAKIQESYPIHTKTNNKIKQIKNNKNNWTRVKILGKVYRLNPNAERIYRNIAEVILVTSMFISVIIMYFVLTL